MNLQAVSTGAGGAGGGLYEALLGAILAGRLRAGDRLAGERALMQEHGISRNSVREALARLRACGLLVVGQGRATVVGPLDREWMAGLFPLLLPEAERSDFRQFFRFRLLVEPETAAGAARSRVKDKSERLCAVTLAMEEAKAGALRATADYRFHLTIAQLSGQAFSVAMLELMHPIFMSSIGLSCQFNRERYRRTERFHRAIRDAIEARDESGARLSMQEHLEFSMKQFLR
jgi:DNA-binding FadR family transcriptional regulator